jgi:CRP/FNR family transcriptional regulator, dissimilatory nitrate respiration regulator
MYQTLMVPLGNICYDRQRFMKNSFKLQKLSLFEHMRDGEADALLAQVVLTQKRVAKGATILSQGDHYTQLHILARGTAFAEMTDVTGKSMRIETLHAPEVLAPGIIFSRNDEMPGSVFAKTDCQFFTLSRADVGHLCTQSVQFRDNLLRLISDRFVFISQRMSFLSFTTIKGKIAQYLLTLERGERDTVVLPSKIEELAGYFGVTRPSVSRVFIELEQKGLIAKRRNHVRILDVPGLKELLL